MPLYLARPSPAKPCGREARANCFCPDGSQEHQFISFALPMPSSRLTNYLRMYRKRAHLSQDEVAFLLGSRSGARVSRYERCRQTPNLRTLLAYEFLFRTPIRE